MDLGRINLSPIPDIDGLDGLYAISFFRGAVLLLLLTDSVVGTPMFAKLLDRPILSFRTGLILITLLKFPVMS